MIGRGEFAQAMGAGARPGDKVVADHVQHVVGGGMPPYQADHAPVVNHIIDILNLPLRLGVAALVVDEQVVAEGHAVALAEAAEALRIDAFADDAVLDGEIGAGVEVHRVPAAPLDGDVIEDDVVAVGEVDGAFLILAGGEALAETNVAEDQVMRGGQGNLGAYGADAGAGRGAAVDGDVAENVEWRFEGDVAADIEDDRAMFLTHGLAQRPWAVIVEIGDMDGLAASAARGVGAEAFSAQKGQCGPSRLGGRH